MFDFSRDTSRDTLERERWMRNETQVSTADAFLFHLVEKVCPPSCRFYFFLIYFILMGISIIIFLEIYFPSFSVSSAEISLNFVPLPKMKFRWKEWTHQVCYPFTFSLHFLHFYCIFFFLLLSRGREWIMCFCIRFSGQHFYICNYILNVDDINNCGEICFYFPHLYF